VTTYESSSSRSTAIPVHRSEVYEEIQRTNRAAAGEPEPKAPAERAKVADLGKGRRAPSKE
jgi:hypothetical protein